jgi:excinuclease ABC subunit A
VKVDGEQRLLEEEIKLDKKFKHTIEVVVDRLVMKPDLRTRLAQSVETAAQLAEGSSRSTWSTSESMLFSETFACPDHGVSLPELQPRIFSFNSPHGACPRCTGSAHSRRSTRTCSCPIRRSRSARARSCRGRSATRASTSR